MKKKLQLLSLKMMKDGDEDEDESRMHTTIFVPRHMLCDDTTITPVIKPSGSSLPIARTWRLDYSLLTLQCQIQ